MNVLKYIRNNPKKVIFGTVVSGYLGRYIKGLYEDNEFRHTTCREVLQQGTTFVNWHYNPKNITVFINPAANNGKAMKLFQKNAAPIFHLSGCNVNVITLDHEGQAKQFMSVLEDTDAIVAAGGNGTVNEVITGLLRRPDFEKWVDVPIGIIPLGETNTLFHQLCNSPKANSNSQQIMNAANHILGCHCKSIDVMKITVENGKSAFALSDLRWGSYSDAYSRTSKYWFWGPLKKYMTFVFASYKSNTQSARQLELQYCNPTPTSELDQKETIKTSQTKSTDPLLATALKIFSSIWRPFSRSKKTEVKNTDMDTSPSEVSDDVSTVEYQNVVTYETLEFSASINTENASQAYNSSAQICVEHSKFSPMDFIKNGVKRFSSLRPQPIQPETELFSELFQITPVINTKTESWYRIDNENFEAMPCRVSVLPKKIKLIIFENNLMK